MDKLLILRSFQFLYDINLKIDQQDRIFKENRAVIHCDSERIMNNAKVN